MKREKGIIYYLENFTAPKVYNGLYFECLLTDQKIPSHEKIKKSTGVHIKDWKHEIYKPERFNLNADVVKSSEYCDNCKGCAYEGRDVKICASCVEGSENTSGINEAE